MRHQSVIAVAIGIAFVLPASMSIAQGQRQGQDRSLDREIAIGLTSRRRIVTETETRIGLTFRTSRS